MIEGFLQGLGWGFGICTGIGGAFACWFILGFIWNEITK